MGAIVDRLLKRLKTIGKAIYSLITQKYQQLEVVDDDVKLLSGKLTEIQSVLKNAEEKQLDDPPMRDWLGKLKNAAHDGEEVLESFETETRRWQEKQKRRFIKCPCSASEIEYKLESAQEIKQILKRLDQIAEEKDKFHLSERTVNRETRTSPEIRRTSSAVFEPDVVGRDDDKNKIVDLLISEKSNREEGEISCLSIIGVGGLGKTTVAQLVYNDDRVKDNFDSMMWVCVTESFDFRSIMKGMLEYHTNTKYDINSLSNRLLQSRILHFLAGKKFLLVLDDVSAAPTSDELEALLGLLKQGGKGSKVLVTSQDARVSEIMGTQSPYLLEILPDEQCWLVFEKIAFKQGNVMDDGVRRDLEEIGRKIVGKCNGLPLAVKAMGGILRGNDDVKKWKRVLNQMWEAEARSNAGKPFRYLFEEI